MYHSEKVLIIRWLHLQIEKQFEIDPHVRETGCWQQAKIEQLDYTESCVKWKKVSERTFESVKFNTELQQNLMIVISQR